MTLPIEHDLFNDTKQWVCLQCGYNMIGTMTDVCPLTAHHDLMCQHFSGHKVKQLYTAIRNRRTTNSRWRK